MKFIRYVSTYLLNFFYICGSFLYNPFDNYRRVTKHKNPLISLPIWILIIIYFSASGFFYRKSSLLTIFLFSFFLIIFLLFSYIFHKKASFREVFNIWSFSYLPTLLWFSVTFILYIFFPPRGSHSAFQFVFSIAFLFFSLFCLYVKILCLFIVFKNVIKLSLSKTIVSMFLIWGLVIFLGISLYNLHFFRIPFI
jgi:hypothetical protein